MSLKNFINEKQIKEQLDGMVQDDIGEFWVVTKASDVSEIKDILFDSTVKNMMLQAKGGLEMNDVIYIGKDKQQAIEIAQHVLSSVKSGEESFKRNI